MLYLHIFLLTFTAVLIITARVIVNEEKKRTYVHAFFCRNCREHIKEMK